MFELAEYYGLKVLVLSDLPDNVAGFLDNRDEPQYIAVNGNLPLCEQIFTVGHELCHYLSRHNRAPRKYRNRVLDSHFKSKGARVFVRFVRRFTNRVFSAETEADMFAIGAMIQIGPPNELRNFLRCHPEKTRLFIYQTVVLTFGRPIHFIKAVVRKFFSPQTAS